MFLDFLAGMVSNNFPSPSNLSPDQQFSFVNVFVVSLKIKLIVFISGKDEGKVTCKCASASPGLIHFPGY